MPPTRALDGSRPPFYRWFPDAELNVCHNALDRHVEAGRGERAALVYDSPVTGIRRTYSYAGLRDEVARFAGVLAGLGVGRGDRVVIYLPMVPEAAIAMLACARLGAVHSVVFGGFAPRELAARIDDATPSVIVSASSGIEGSRVIELATHPDKHATFRAVGFVRGVTGGGRIRPARFFEVDTSLVSSRSNQNGVALDEVQPWNCPRGLGGWRRCVTKGATHTAACRGPGRRAGPEPRRIGWPGGFTLFARSRRRGCGMPGRSAAAPVGRARQPRAPVRRRAP
ncbi:hypothetical protein GCM10023321_11680 [Pseudonocardia eucalypti]|uniref:AMP-dependent synthetase/ligase domain-containing protein n=1 Tax=Pseudonocardia eucalypti TaxID=648755 RepID=A0ABP9PPJ5_9PSEU|nr:hypothetical protein [Pseudonocardia eucalypti]